MSSQELEGVSVDRPCPKRWSELVGDERRRFCSACSLHVTNLSALTRSEAQDFLEASRGRVCVTYVPAPGGGARLRGRLRSPRRFTGTLASLASFLLGLVTLLPGCRPTSDGAPDSPGGTAPPDPDTGRIMGKPSTGKVGPDPVCAVDDDDRMIMGEMVAPEPQPAPEVVADHEPKQE